MKRSYHISEVPAAIGVSELLRLDYNPLCRKPKKVHILALGDVGMTMLLGLRLLGADVIQSLGICDINTNNTERLEMEMNQVRYPFAGTADASYPMLPPVGIIDEASLFACDVFIFCASKGVPPVGVVGDVRMSQLEANLELVRHAAALAGEAAFKGLVCIVSDPVDPLCRAFFMESGLRPAQIQGYGLGVMNARACYYAERNEAYSRYLTEGRAFGPHGQDLVLADSLSEYNDVLSRQLTGLVVHANSMVRELGYKPYIAPALSSAALSILLTLRGQWHYGSVYLGDAGNGAYFGVKNRMTEQGPVYEDAAVCSLLYERLKQAYVNLAELPWK
ncbi:lactate dehydrogenase [Megasphaera cerevisiae DSM 20462]|uniref:Lactate dehydrogenase n=1 Tax=Megasphaera cerevisiae DSM 20462 TaxID=1122219 RepID=A0A0J6WV74_9FIRM|nr:lactate dehydrogenase [Megasphaera cerevisiae]KMO86459.1 lactate dehydrogenase [Megasphaera cerevisiae DSM 20462]OKY53388.1 lactate dehydrogenase [Megasphaera cerevisiae]SJZ94876.1 Malate/lactate dehydrogenase [Megasphaera cerevisiae DSM 20462]